MSMHLVGPYLTTTRYNGKVKLNAKQRRAQEEHEAWLKKQGIGTKTKTEKRVASPNTIPDYREGARSTVPLGNNIGNGYKNGIMENLHKETPEVQKAILDKASRVMPLYNKGGLQYATPGTDLTTVGSKSRRG